MGRLKILVTIMLMAVAAGMSGQALRLTADKSVVMEAEGIGMITIKGTNTMSMSGWQMFLYLPGDVRLLSTGVMLNQRYPWVEAKMDYAHTTYINTIRTSSSGNSYMITCYGSKPTAIEGNEGDLVTLVLFANKKFKGVYEGRITNLSVADMQMVPAQTNCEGDFVFKIMDRESSAIYDPTIADDDAQGNTDGQWYKVNGQRVERPTAPGLYIRNGRLIAWPSASPSAGR